MASVNKVIIVGHLGKDPETRYMPSGEAVTSISVATSETWKDKTSGEKMEKTEWHDITGFGKLAEIMGEYLKKGALVYIEGQLETQKWQDKETGKDRYRTHIKARSLQMLGRPAGERGGEHEQHREEPAPRQQEQKPAGAAKKPAGKFDDMADDIPF